MPYFCSKEYIDIPFAHRQHNHDGHCADIHGHNWSFKFTFAADELDKNGFVFDFGDLKELKTALEGFDHALILNEDDPHRDHLMSILEPYARIIILKSGSAEGLARYAWKIAQDIVTKKSEGRVRVTEVTCSEDWKNSATFIP